MKNKVTIEHDGEVFTHIAETIGNYDTLCGLDGNDSGVGTRTVETPKGAKVNCPQCFLIWQSAQPWKKTDFDPSLK